MGLSSAFWDDIRGEAETSPMGTRGLKTKSVEVFRNLRRTFENVPRYWKLKVGGGLK